jgi:2-phospho-L-lactate transferase/gluconeogenesis factor (CofD/UPF0052 family)
MSTVLSADLNRAKEAELLEYRLNSKDFFFENGELDLDTTFMNLLNSYASDISITTFNVFFDLMSFFASETKELITQDISCLEDMALGNIIIAGSYLRANKDFNVALNDLIKLLRINVSINNVTDGSNRVLVAIGSNGELFLDEASIVEMKRGATLDQVFLLDDYLSESEIQSLSELDKKSRCSALNKLQKLPKLALDIDKILKASDLIVYGPGTQHSSLFPSYLTSGLAEIISELRVEKILISNLDEDNDIREENLSSLVDKFSYYMNQGVLESKRSSEYVSQILLSSSRQSYLPWGFSDLEDRGIGIHIGQLRKSEGDFHDGPRVVNGLISLSRRRESLQTYKAYDLVSVIMPNLNEVEYLPRVLEEIYYFDWLSFGILPEFILVDSNSSDGSVAIAEKFPGLRVIKLDSDMGRGFALRTGIESATGEFLVTFPTDGEYEAKAVVEVVNLLRQNRGTVVYGSRSSLAVDNFKKLKKVYQGNFWLYILSNWGGVCLTLISGVKFSRWISDPLTSVKGSEKSTWKSLSKSGNSANWDTRIIVDASRNQIPILEVPVKYNPRNREAGKKMNILWGMKALFQLLWSRR